MTKKMKQSIKILAAVASLAGLVTALGFGCGLGFQPVGLVADNFGSSLDSGDNNVLEVIANVRTTQVPVYTNVYNSYLSCLDVQPDNNTRDELDRQIGNFSENGSALSVNAPMLFANISLAAAICQKKVNDERNLAAANRMIFNAIDLNAGPGNIQMAALGETVNRIARSCWQRNEDSTELTDIVEGFNEADAADGANNGNETRNLMLYLCTSMLASNSGYEM